MYRNSRNTYDLIIVKSPSFVSATYTLEFLPYAGGLEKLYYVHSKVGGGSQLVMDTNFLEKTWWLLVFTRDVDGNIVFYRNGNQDITPVACSGTPMSNTDSVRVGFSNSSLYPFDGWISLMRIYNRVLSSSEVADIFASEKSLFGY